MSEPSGRTFICSVVFIDIVRYSQVSITQQMAMKSRLNAAIAQAVEGVVDSERIILDTGDGAAICFLGDPEDALFAATAINKSALTPGDGGRLILRTGLNLGPIKLVVDLNGRNNVVGDGINVAQRIMSFAEEGEILVSRSYYEVVSRLTDGNERLFRYMGVRSDKHVREHQLYAFSMHGEEPQGVVEGGLPVLDLQPASEDGDNGWDRAAPDLVEAAPAVRFPPDLLRAEERLLARYIGPLARVMVARLAPSASSFEALRTSLGELIADEADRSSYLAATAGAPDVPDEMPPVAFDPVPPAPATPPAGPEPGPFVPDEGERQVIEHALAVAIGPLARVLLRKALGTAPSRDALHDQLASSIRNEHDRAVFLATVRRYF